MRTVALVLLAAGTASATPILISGATPIGQTWTVRFGGNVAGVDRPGLSAEAVLELTSFGLESGRRAVGLKVQLHNTSASPITAARVSALAFDVSAPLAGIGKNGGTGNTRVSGLFANDRAGAFPNNFGDVDVCFTSGNSCQGGSNVGVAMGASGVLHAVLVLQTGLNTVTLQDFGVRYQSIDGPGMNGQSGTGRGWLVPVEPPAAAQAAVPEPASLFSAGLALLVMAWGAKRMAGLRRPAMAPRSPDSQRR